MKGRNTRNLDKNLCIKIIIQNMKDWKIFLVFLFAAPLFFFNLGKYGLTDYDEAWYADIARNIVVNNQPLLLTFNQAAYYDHPPLGFNLMAISYRIFGINEFSTRFPSALLGFLSLFLIYLIGKSLVNRGVGLGAALILPSSVWFIFRARTGNLDAILIFFCLLTFHFILNLVNEPKKIRWYICFGLSFGLLLSVKSLFGIVLLLPLGLYLILNRTKITIKGVLLAAFFTLLITLPWFLISLLTYQEAYLSRMTHIGLRQWSRITPDYLHLLSSNTFIYLHSSIRKWYYPALLAVIFSVVSFKNRKKIWPISALVLVLIFSFISNGDTSIWHLLPLLPFLALLTSYSFYVIFSGVFSKLHFWKPSMLGQIVTVLLISIVAIYQIWVFRNEIQLRANGYSSWSQLAIEAKNMPEALYIDGPDLWPTTVFYSQKKVRQIYGLAKPSNSLSGILTFGPKPFLLITENWRLTMDNIPEKNYKRLKEVDGKVLLLVN